MSEERFMRIEHQLETHDKDLHSIARSLEGINGHMERTNDILHDIAIKDERFSSRINAVEASTASRIVTATLSIERAHKRIDKVDTIFSWINKIVMTSIILGLLALIIKTPPV